MIARAVVRVVRLVARADDGNANGVKPRIDNRLDAFRPSCIAIHVDLPSLRLCPDPLDALCYAVCRETRLALAPLPEADDRFGGRFQMVYPNGGNLLRGWRKFYALLRRRTAFRRL